VCIEPESLKDGTYPNSSNNLERYMGIAPFELEGCQLEVLM
jgi:hypothetical protein